MCTTRTRNRGTGGHTPKSKGRGKPGARISKKTFPALPRHNLNLDEPGGETALHRIAIATLM